MPGGLMQLVNYGAQDIYLLSGNTHNIFTHSAYNPINSSTDENNLMWSTLNKIINLEKNDECPISNISFISECSYCICYICKYNIDADTLKKCFQFNDKKCPMCRSKWTDFNIYKNDL